MKIWGIVILIGILGGGIWKISVLAADNARLEGNNKTLLEANSSYETAIAELEEDKAARDKAIAERTRRILELNKLILKAKDELKAVKAMVTVEERACLESSIPEPVLDLMFPKRRGGQSPRGSEGVPATGAVQ
jgi:hypothetical protein